MYTNRNNISLYLYMYIYIYIYIYTHTHIHPLVALSSLPMLVPKMGLLDLLSRSRIVRPVRLLRVWISEGLTQADS